MEKIIAKAHHMRFGEGIELHNESGYNIVVFKDGNSSEFKYHFRQVYFVNKFAQGVRTA